MGLYYALISLSVIMFGVQFLFTDKYQKECGQSALAAHRLTFFSGIVGVIILLIINGFRVEYTHFTLICAIASALVSLFYSICSLKALAKINLSLYSLFAMLGGMVLPFVQGLIFYDEKLTVGKIICFVLITVALALTVNKDTNKGGWIYYVGVFILNGMSGVFSTLLKKFTYTADTTVMDGITAGYSVAMAVFAIVIAAILLVTVGRKEKNTVTLKAACFSMASGSLNRIANFILVVSLMIEGAQPSLQYPLVTGVVMVVSTLLCFFTPKKPKARDLVSVAFAFAGVLALMFIPI